MKSRAGNAYYTDEEENFAKENKNALEYAMSRGYELIAKGSYFRLKEHNSLVFSPNGDYHWNSRGIKNGDAISFIMNYEGGSYKDAILTLAGKSGYVPSADVRKKIESIPKEKKPLDIPKHASNNNIVFGYLIKERGIDPALVSSLVAQHKIYQSEKYNNVVMVGFNEKQEPKYISMRSTNTFLDKPFKLDATGSDKKYPFVIEATGMPDTVCVCESPIEVMSLSTLYELMGSQYKGAHIISLGGTSTNSLEYFLSQHSEIKNIVVCTNNDKDKVKVDEKTGKQIITNAGKANRENIAKTYSDKYNVEFSIPPLNDWSDVLKRIRQVPKFKLHERNIQQQGRENVSKPKKEMER